MSVFSTILLVGLLVAQTPDTLQTVTVIADRVTVVSGTDTLAVNRSCTIGELLIKSPGIYVGDNGGYAGLKTVSIRGLGSPHTSIYVDGVKVGNVQSGQADLGALGLDNFSSVVINYAQNSLSFTTVRPSFNEGRNVGGYARFSAGSFGTYIPSARIDWKISNTLALSANADAVFSKGNFHYGDGLVRENNDIKEIRGGLDFFGTVLKGDWHAKLWCNASDRGTPGSTAWPSSDRQKDMNFYAQGLLRKQFTRLYHLTASAKLSYDDIRYTSSWGDSRYGQTEAQLNTSHRFKLNDWLALCAVADLYWDGLSATNYNQQRFGTTESVSASFNVKGFRADIGVKYDGVFDKDQKGRNCVSPSLDVRHTVFNGFDIVAFARRAYRVPTFNELYYVGYGNPDLKPEDAALTGIGIDWRRKFGFWNVKTKIGGFYNYLWDKITSAPSDDDPNIWLPYNIGRVRSAGIDIVAGLDFSDGGWIVSFSAKYGFQDAVDKTPDSDTFDRQIAYVAKHSLSLDLAASFKGWSFESVWNLRTGRRDSYGDMPDWNTLDIFFNKSFDLGKAGVPALKLVFKNVTDNCYELTSGYPMPGFSVLGGVEYSF